MLGGQTIGVKLYVSCYKGLSCLSRLHLFEEKKYCDIGKKLHFKITVLNLCSRSIYYMLIATEN